MAEIITFINQKGGVGKTSLAMNFGIRLKMAGARVLLVDMDPQCNLTYIMGVDDPPHTIYEVMLRQVSAANAIVQAGECDLIAASPNLSTLNLTLPTIEQVKGVPKGVTAQKLEWPNAPDGTVPETETGTVRAALTLKTDGTHPILVGEYKYPTVNGVEHMYTRNSSGNDYVTDGSTVMMGSIDLPVKSKGVSVSGTVKSYNPNNAVTIQLMQEGAEKYSTTIAAATGSGQKEQNFSFPAVAAGTYDLVVTKSAHLKYTVKNVTVGNAPLDLTVHGNAAIRNIMLPAGDVNGDGTINSKDLNEIWSPANYLKNTTDAGVNPLTDLNGDSTINSKDLNIVWKAENYLKTASDCEADYNG